MDTQNLFRMYFGRNIGDDSRVTLPAVESFLQTHIAPVFSGFTVYDGIGYWEGKPEDCFIVEIIHESNAASQCSIAKICEAYKEQFDQESVLVTRQPVDMEFV